MGASTSQKPKVKTRKQILWFDQNVTSNENQKALKEHFPEIKIMQYTDYQSASEFIKGSREPFIVITSGKDGQKFVELIHDCDHVLCITVFCYSVEKHQQWAKSFEKIILVTNDDKKMSEIVWEVYRTTKFIEYSEKVAREFWMVIFKYLHNLAKSGKKKRKLKFEIRLQSRWFF